MKRRITKTQFIAALQEYGDNEGYSYDEFDREMVWTGFKKNEKRKDWRAYLNGKTEQEIWLPLLEDYLIQDHEDDFVEIES